MRAHVILGKVVVGDDTAAPGGVGRGRFDAAVAADRLALHAETALAAAVRPACHSCSAVSQRFPSTVSHMFSPRLSCSHCSPMKPRSHLHFPVAVSHVPHSEQPSSSRQGPGGGGGGGGGGVTPPLVHLVSWRFGPAPEVLSQHRAGWVTVSSSK